MTDAPERILATEDTAHFGEDRFHSTTPMRGLTEYLRADIAAAREADLRAEVERLTAANREAAMKSLADLGQAQEALDRAIAAEAEAARLRGLLDEARRLIIASLGHNRDNGDFAGREALLAWGQDTLAKIGGQHD